jgi:retron-type reverse transcriptase
MAENTNDEKLAETELKDWRERRKLMGRQAFELSEMERLGFWPPTEEARQKTAQARAALAQVQDQILPLRTREREIEKFLSEMKDMETLIKEARAIRIERSKAARAERKARRAQEQKERREADAGWRAQTLPHLGPIVSRGLRYHGGDGEKLAASGLPILQSAEDLARALEIPVAQLAWLCYDRAADGTDHYRRWSVPKKSGGTRPICSPKPKMRAAQDWVLQNILSKVAPHEAAAAFRPAMHIGHNAAAHAHAPNGPAIVLRLDLEDFFPSIGVGLVKRAFEKEGYNEGVATLLALLCTQRERVALTLDGEVHHVALSERGVPQGAPTSPALTNMLCRRLDARATGMARRYGFTYTRYADDLVFSSPDKNANLPAMQRGAELIIGECSFKLNAKKTAVMRRHQRQTVTGLVVNAPASTSSAATPGASTSSERVSRRDIRKLRATLHNIEVRGREAVSAEMGQDALAWARGYLSFVYMVCPEQEAQLRAKFPWVERHGEA